MAHLRHIALSVPDPEKTAQFYEKTFGMKRVGKLDHNQASGIYLSDGVMNMAVLRYKLDEVVYKEGSSLFACRRSEKIMSQQKIYPLFGPHFFTFKNFCNTLDFQNIPSIMLPSNI